MASYTRQVPQIDKPIKGKSPSKIDKLLWAFLKAEKEKLASEPFGSSYSKRSYPGEVEARSVVRYLESITRPSKQSDVFQKSLRTLQQIEETIAKQKNKRNPLLEHFKTLMPAAKAVEALSKRVSGRKRIVDFAQNGFVVQPRTLQGVAALGVMLLFRQERLGRIRQCLHCGAWFYARFKHQSFCSDQEKRCQWNHYHSPEWRKEHREQNRKHQRAYRKGIFGKRSS